LGTLLFGHWKMRDYPLGVVFFSLLAFRRGSARGTQVDFNFSKLNSVGDPFFLDSPKVRLTGHWELWTEPCLHECRGRRFIVYLRDFALIDPLGGSARLDFAGLLGVINFAFWFAICALAKASNCHVIIFALMMFSARRDAFWPAEKSINIFGECSTI